MKDYRSNKSYKNQLTRWVDRLLPFNFEIERWLGTLMGLFEYILLKLYLIEPTLKQ